MELTLAITDKITWIFLFLLLYWGYCIFWTIKGTANQRTVSDYFIAGRRLSFGVFILAATATIFSGWTVLGHPGFIYTNGFQYPNTFFAGIVVAFPGVLFLKRQWMLGRRFGFITPGEMFAYYFQSELIRLLIVLVALVFSVSYVGIQLRGVGFLFNVLTDGLLGVEFGMWVLSIIVIGYVATGGLRTVANVDILQAVLLVVGIVIIGVITLYFVDGWERLMENMVVLSQEDTLRTPDGYSHYIAIPGAIQFVNAASKAEGGIWTGMMNLTYMFGVLGIMASPVFSMWAFASRNPAPFAPQQVWVSSLGMGLIIILFITIQGIGGHFLGANQALLKAYPQLVNPVMLEGLGGRDLMEIPGGPDMLVPQLINLVSDTAPWLIGLLMVCILSALQSTAAGYIATAGGILTRDLFRRFIMPNADDNLQKFIGRLCTVVIVLLALIVASTATDALVLMGGLAVSYGFQLWPALIAICYWPFLTRQGIELGLVVGLIAVTLTEAGGPQWLGITAWGRWPLTIHSAGWGILFNFSAAVLVSLVTQDDQARKLEFHSFLREYAALPPKKRRFIPWAWIITILWFIFAIGPGAVVGNTLFGNPNEPESWWLGMPSIWVWQSLWWALGVAMMWFLAYYMEMGTGIKTEVTPLAAERKVRPRIRLKLSAWRSPRFR